jgi:hypothetical protein
VPGVHATEQRLDEPVDDGPAEPGADQPSDRDVLADIGGGQPGVQRHPGQLERGEEAARGERTQVRRHPHDGPRRDRPELTAAPDRRRGGLREDEVSAETRGGSEGRSLVPPQEEGLGALVDRQTADVGHLQLPAEAGRALEHRDPDPRACLAAQEDGRSQPGDAAADHDHVPHSGRAHDGHDPRS